MKLYLNDVSSASARVRIALALKGLAVETRQVDIFGKEAESRQAAYRDINPQGLVPAILTDNGVLLIQSLAIAGVVAGLDRVPAFTENAPAVRR
jgi:maleylpyruvate isomerase